MRQAILTKYLGPTNNRGSRVKAVALAGSITIPWDPALNVEDNHTKVAAKLADKFQWMDFNTIYGGSLPNGSSYCFVLVPKE